MSLTMFFYDLFFIIFCTFDRVMYIYYDSLICFVKYFLASIISLLLIHSFLIDLTSKMKNIYTKANTQNKQINLN